MTDATALPPDPNDDAAERAMRHGDWCRALGEMGMAMARDLSALARAEPEPATDPEAQAGVAERRARIGVAFARVARVMHQTMRLENETAEAEAARQRGDYGLQQRPDEARRRAELAKTSRADRRRDMLRNVVPDMIDAQKPQGRYFDRDEAIERYEQIIDDEISDHDMDARPMVELIALVCQAVKVDLDWSLYDPAEWNAEDYGLTPDETRTRPGAPERPPPPCANWPPPGVVYAELMSAA